MDEGPHPDLGDALRQIARSTLAEQLERLRDAVFRYDSATVVEVVDEISARIGVEATIQVAVLPVLNDLGMLWASSKITPIHEHLATESLRHWLGARLLEAVATGEKTRGTVVSACAPDELHDLPLLACTVVLARLGWQTRYLGQRVPLPGLYDIARTAQADAVVICASDPTLLEPHASTLAQLAQSTLVAIGGRAASPELAARCGAQLLSGDPVDGARRLDALVSGEGS